MMRRANAAGRNFDDEEEGTRSGLDALNSIAQEPLFPTVARRKLGQWLGPRLAKITEWVLLAGFVLLILDIIYLGVEKVRFTNPCLVAKRVTKYLEDHPRVGSTPPENIIPKIIHQQWKTSDIPEGDFTEYNKEFKRLFPEPEFKHVLWTDESMRELIANDFPWFLKEYDGYAMNIQRADSSRYFILYRFGGLYADLDYEPLVNFWSMIPGDRVSLVESPYIANERVQNSLMASPRADPFWNVTFKVLQERSGSDEVLSSTGPSMMDVAMTRAHSSWVHVLPCENFQRIPLGTAGVNSPFLSKVGRSIMANTPLSKTCGDWARTDDCQFGIHHNSVTYFADTLGMFAFLDF